MTRWGLNTAANDDGWRQVSGQGGAERGRQGAEWVIESMHARTGKENRGYWETNRQKRVCCGRGQLASLF